MAKAKKPNLLGALLGGFNPWKALLALVARVTADQVRPGIQELLEKRYSPAGRAKLAETAERFAAALRAHQVDEAAGILADALGEFKA